MIQRATEDLRLTEVRIHDYIYSIQPSNNQPLNQPSFCLTAISVLIETSELRVPQRSKVTEVRGQTSITTHGSSSSSSRVKDQKVKLSGYNIFKYPEIMRTSIA